MSTMSIRFELSVILCIILSGIVSTITNCTGSDVHITQINNRPIIGILAQEYYSDQLSLEDTNREPSEKSHLIRANRSYISSSYVKWIQSGGGRVVPIHIDRDPEYYASMLSKINGILFPGGENDLESSSYARSMKIIWNLVFQINQNGSRFPLWGTCLGMEEMAYLAAGQRSVLDNCNAHDLARPLRLTSEPQSPPSILEMKLHFLMATKDDKENITAHYHMICLTRERFVSEPKWSRDFRLLATNEDRDGMEFVSLMEHKKYPIFGSLFHPEKNQFEFFTRSNIQNVPHSSAAIELGNLLARHFVDEARRNRNSFSGGEEEERQYIIDNKQPHVEYDLYAEYVPLYFFDRLHE